eukprot:2066870-Alexandrium_andersonii.AAC.1
MRSAPRPAFPRPGVGGIGALAVLRAAPEAPMRSAAPQASGPELEECQLVLRLKDRDRRVP